MVTHHLQVIDEVDSGGLRAAFGCFPSGVTALCGLGENGPDGMAASSFTSVSIDPPLVSVCVQKTSATWPRLKEMQHLGLSVLSEEQEGVCRSLSSKQGDRFANVPWESVSGGAVFVEGAAARLNCVLESEVEAGDHLVAFLRIVGLQWDPDAVPLVFHGSRFRNLSPLAELATAGRA